MPAVADGVHPHAGAAMNTSTQLPQHSSIQHTSITTAGIPSQAAVGPSFPPNNSTSNTSSISTTTVQHAVNSRRAAAAVLSDPAHHHIVNNNNMRPAQSVDRLDEYLVQMVEEIWQEHPQDDDSTESSPRPLPLTATHHLQQHQQHATQHHHQPTAASSYSVCHSVSDSTTVTGAAAAAAAADDYFMAPEDSDDAELGYDVDYGDVQGGGDDDVLESARCHQAAMAATSGSIASTFYGAVAALEAMDTVGGGHDHEQVNRALRDRIIADAAAGAERLSAQADDASSSEEEEEQEKETVATIRKVPAAAQTTRGEKSLAVTCERFISVCEMFQSADSDITLSASPKQSTRTAMNSPLNGALLGDHSIIDRAANRRKRLNVEAVSKAMDVPVRRIYDLISILEVLSLVSSAYRQADRQMFILLLLSVCDHW